MEGRLNILYLFGVGMLLMVLSCTEQKAHTAAAVRDRDSASMMVSYGVNTLISDSGVIKYRIVTERWDVNTIKNPPRWTFELWELRGRVSIRNVNGLIFNSDELWWDGIKHEFYSNKFSRVVTPERTLEGTYFRSDEHMAHYEVKNSVGSFQSEDMEGDSQQPANNQTPAANGQQPKADSQKADTAFQIPVRQAAVRHKANQKSTYQP